MCIKNMVCQRCKMDVESELHKLKLHPITISLGEVVSEEKSLSEEQSHQLNNALRNDGMNGVCLCFY